MTHPPLLAGMAILEIGDGVALAQAGRVLAALGAHVVKVEAPTGCELRRRPPFLDATGRSAMFEYLNVSKASMIADVDQEEGRRGVREAAARSHIIFDALPLGHPLRQWLDEDAGRVHVSMRPFGVAGPKKQWVGEELTIFHAGGEGYLMPNGLIMELFPDLPPLKVFGNFAEFSAGIAAALAGLSAWLALPRVGGQTVDTSSQDVNVALSAMTIQRLGDGVQETRQTRSFSYGGVVACSDGYVEILTLEQHQWTGLVRMMGDPEWAHDSSLADSVERAKQGAWINQHLREWARSQTTASLLATAEEYGVPAAAYASTQEVMDSPQFRARNVFVPVEIGNLGTVPVFGSPFQVPGCSPVQLRAAPRLGEPTNANINASFPRGPQPAVEAEARGPLTGIRILDFTVHNAGPFCTHVLSLLGAECIKVESRVRPDIFRRPHPVYGRMHEAEFDQDASNKKSITLNLKTPQGVALAKQLVGKVDMVVESFRPGVMARLGLDYDSLRAINPSLVMVSVSSSGQTGPERQLPGYAPLFGAWGALGTMTGFAGSPPVEMRHIMDHSTGLYAALAAVSLLCARERSGIGLYADVSAREVAASYVGPAFLVRAVTGQDVERVGNHDFTMCPHNVYPCEGEDAWISIVIRNDEEWHLLVDAMGQPDLAERFPTAGERKKNEAALDRYIEHWTRNQSRHDLAARLQDLGIAAAPCMTASDLATDSHLLSRGAIQVMHHSKYGDRRVVGAPWIFSKTPAQLRSWTPELGEHNWEIFGQMGMSLADLRQLHLDKVIY